MLNIKSFVCGSAQENTYIIYNNQNKALLIDPGAIHPSITDFVESKHLNVQAILLTHCHYDHIIGVDFYEKKWSIPVYIHKLDAPGLADPKQNLSFYLKDPLIISASVTELVGKKGVFEVGDFIVEYMLLPGHSIGSVAFKFEDMLVSGDVLFEDSVGRYDFPFCDVKDLAKSLNKLFLLDESINVYPGHGNGTTIGREKHFNIVAQSVINQENM